MRIPPHGTETEYGGLMELLNRHEGKRLILGTHGTALSTILNYYDPTYQHENYIKMIDYMPYIIRLDFEKGRWIGKEELLIVEKEFTAPQNISTLSSPAARIRAGPEGLRPPGPE